MKVICDTLQLQQIASAMALVVKSRTPAPILQCIKIECTKDCMTFAATNLELFCTMQADQVDILKLGVCVVPAARFDSIVKSFSAKAESVLNLMVDKGKLTISGDHAKFELIGAKPEQFSEFDLEFDTEGTCRAREFAQALRTLAPAVADNPNSWAVTGVWLAKQDNRLLMSTVSNSVYATNRIACEWSSDFKRVTIPDSVIRFLISAFQDQDAETNVQFGVSEDGQRMYVADDLTAVGFALLQVQIPSVPDITKTFEASAVVDTAEFLAMVNQAKLVTREETRGITFSVGANGGIDARSVGSEIGSSEIRHSPKKLEGKALETAINPELLVPGLRGCGDLTEIRFVGDDKPVVLQSGELVWVVGNIRRSTVKS